MSRPFGFKVCHSKLSLDLKGTLPLSTACSTEMYMRLPIQNWRAQSTGENRQVDFWKSGGQYGSSDSLKLLEPIKPPHPWQKRSNIPPANIVELRSRLASTIAGRQTQYNISHIRLSLYPKKSTKLLHIWWFESAIHSHHISWRIEIICLIMSKLDVATMLHHMWSNGLEGTVTPRKNLSAVGNGSFCTRTYSMCSYKEHKLQEECLLLNANSRQRGFILKPASIWYIFK